MKLELTRFRGFPISWERGVHDVEESLAVPGGVSLGFTARPTAGDGGGCELGFQRYDKVVEALGGHGEFVEQPDEIRPALDRALAAGKPAIVNVCIDPDIPASGGLLGALSSTQATPAKS